MVFPKISLASFLLVLCFTGCSAAATPEPTPEAGAAPLPAASATPEPSSGATALPSLTATPALPAAPTSTSTSTAISAPSATPAAAFDELAVMAVDNRVGGWLLTMNVPGVTRALRMALGENTYDCSVDARYPDRLFCQGLAKPPFDAQLNLSFQDPQSGQVLYKSRLVIPTALLVPPTQAGWPETGCDRRGQNVSCETECRIAPNGSPCIVATCTDDCGAYFSVHTCPDMSLDFASCTAEQWARMKALYQIP